MAIQPITNDLPEALTQRLGPGENVYYFMRTNTLLRAEVTTLQKSWFCLTNERLIYDLTPDTGERQVGDIPLAEVTYVRTKELMAAKGCSNPKYHMLHVGKSDWYVHTPVKTEAVAQEVLTALEQIKHLQRTEP